LSWRLKVAAEWTRRSGGGSSFHARGPATANDRSPHDDVVRGTACTLHLLSLAFNKVIKQFISFAPSPHVDLKTDKN